MIFRFSISLVVRWGKMDKAATKLAANARPVPPASPVPPVEFATPDKSDKNK